MYACMKIMQSDYNIWNSVYVNCLFRSNYQIISTHYWKRMCGRSVLSHYDTISYISKEDILKAVAIDFHCIFPCYMEVNSFCQLLGYQHSSKCLLLCSTGERNSYRLGIIWGWLNYDIIFIFGWTILLTEFFYFPRNDQITAINEPYVQYLMLWKCVGQSEVCLGLVLLGPYS